MDVARAAYHLTEDMPQQERFGLTSQIRRSAVSVPSNIAEGHGRLTDRGFAVFLGQARGSLFELQTQIELASGLAYVPQQRADSVLQMCEEVARIINGLLKALRSANG
jgi:four helix bundle protein